VRVYDVTCRELFAKVEAASGADRDKSSKAMSAYQSEWFSQRIKSWDVGNGQGGTAVINAANIAALPYPVFVQIESLCTGTASQGLVILGN
jgi:hypothetical protein